MPAGDNTRVPLSRIAYLQELSLDVRAAAVLDAAGGLMAGDAALAATAREALTSTEASRPVEGGTLLSVVESGFDKVPPHRRMDAFRQNSEGWDGQMKNIEKHVAG